MKLKVSVVGVTLLLAMSAVAFAATTAQGAKPGMGSYAVPAGGTTTSGLPVTGTFTISKFSNVNGVVTAVGTFAGSVNGGPTESTTASAPVTSIDGTALPGGASPTAAAAAAGTCQILDLTLGPLHLDLLGLIVDLNQVHLQITAQQGSGNLLGNLLCSVAGLLDNGGTGGLQGLLNSIRALLNQILGQL
jgi:hypothetical protein